MRLLVYSPAFLPSIGGLELNVANLHAWLARHGFEVTVVTNTPGLPLPELPFRVVRSPGDTDLLALVRWAEVIHFANMSLRGFWPLLLVRRPWVVSHHSWYCRTNGEIAWQDRLKRWLMRRATASVAVSRAMAEDLGPPTQVIPNCYRSDLFRRIPGVERDRDLLFVGRLVSDKGVDLLLEAVAALSRQGLRPGLDVVGEGPERPQLEARVAELGLSRVRFHGSVTGEALVRAMNKHRILVVPSRYREPFGIVALEGAACGCAVVASGGGGLADATGPAGLTFANGSVAELAAALERVLVGGWRPDQAAVERHLAAHHLDVVGARWRELLLQCVDQAPTGSDLQSGRGRGG
jgi:glycogen(starch) synthase